VKLLDRKIGESGLKKEFVAQQLDVSRQALATKIREGRFNTKEVEILRRVLNIHTIEELFQIFFTDFVEENGNKGAARR